MSKNELNVLADIFIPKNIQEISQTVPKVFFESLIINHIPVEKLAKELTTFLDETLQSSWVSINSRTIPPTQEEMDFILQKTPIPNSQNSKNKSVAKVLGIRNYRHFLRLLELERFALLSRFSLYSLFDVSLGIQVSLNVSVSIKVPGLSDINPSVLIGDLVLIRHIMDESIQVTSQVLYVNRRKSLLLISWPLDIAQPTAVDKWNVHLLPSPVSFKRASKAVEYILENPSLANRILFPLFQLKSDAPSIACSIDDLNLYELKLITRDEKFLNIEQQTAISQVLKRTKMTCKDDSLYHPFVILGPPGIILLYSL